MRRLGLAAFVFLMIATPSIIKLIDSLSDTAVAQDEDFPNRHEDHQDLIVIEPVPEIPAEDPQSIYLELCRRKAKLLAPKLLEREIQVLREELIDLQATQRLRDVESQLQRLIDEHPESNAAQRARLMLEYSLRKPVPAGGLRPLQRDEDFESDPFPTPENSRSEFSDDLLPARRAPARRVPDPISDPTFESPGSLQNPSK